MSRIIVVEPAKMLQQAFVIALFPEHQVQVLETLPDSGSAAEAELVVIDAAALRERDLLGAQEIRAVQTWRTPVVWIEPPSELATPNESSRLSAPVKREELRAAVTKGVQSPTPQQPRLEPVAKHVGSIAVPKKKSLKPKLDRLAADRPREIIDLVDVIEEVPAGGERDGEEENKD